MSRAVDPWSKAPRESAAVWSKLSTYDEMVGLRLVVVLDCAEHPIPGRLPDVIERVLRGAGKGRERQHISRAIARIRRLGLLFEHEGQVFLLYSETMWRRYRALGEHYAAKTPVLTVVRDEAPNEHRASTEETLNEHRRDIESELSVEYCSTPTLQRERERDLRESTTCSVETPPAAAPPPPASQPERKPKPEERQEVSGEFALDPVTELRPKLAQAKPKTRTRARQPLDEPRDLAVRIFNEMWRPTRGQGATWVPHKKQFGLITAMVQSYLHPDGKTLNETLFRRAVLAFLGEESWVRYGGWKPEKFLIHHLGGLTRVQSTGTGGFHGNSF